MVALGGFSLDLVQLECLSGFMDNEALGLSTAHLASVARNPGAIPGVFAKQRREEVTVLESSTMVEKSRQNLSEVPKSVQGNGRKKSNSKGRDGGEAATGQALGAAKPVHSAPVHVEHVQDHVHLEQRWHKYFRNPTEWWDNRNGKLHSKSPDFRHKRTKEALWINSSDTPKWVTEVLQRRKPSKKGSVDTSLGIDGSSHVDCTTENVVAPKLLQGDALSWTALISQHTKSGQARRALQIYEEMLEKKVKPSSHTFVAVLKACSSLRDLKSAKRVHDKVVESGCESVVNVGNVLVDVYSKCGSLVDARHVFENMAHRNVVSWNAMIMGYAQMNKGEVALQLYARMQQERTVPNHRTFVAVLKACSSLAAGEEWNKDHFKIKCLEQVRVIHSEIVTNGCELTVFVATTLVDVFAKCGSLVDARGVFEKMPRTVISWNAMILGCAQMGEGEEALQLYARMQEEGVAPDDRTFVGILNACSSLAGSEDGNEFQGTSVHKRCLERVKHIHSEIKQSGFESDVFVGNMLVDVYAKCGSILDSRHIFEKMPHRTVVSWNALIMAYSLMREGEEALQLYHRMQQEGFVPNNRTFLGALKACLGLAERSEGSQDDGILVKKRSLEEARVIHSDIVKGGFESDIFVGNTLVDVYAKCGSLVDARRVFENIQCRSVVSWNAMILGCAEEDEPGEALKLYTRMQEEGLSPDDRTFVGALMACSSLIAIEGQKSGNGKQMKYLEQVRSIHSDVMRRESKPAIFVENMLVDVYAKCGRLVDARCVFEKMPSHNVVSWNAMISGYAQVEESEEALRLYSIMQQEGVVPNERTFVSALKACGALAASEEGKQVDGMALKQQCLEQAKAIHSHVIESGYGSEEFVETMLIDVYAKCGSLVDARYVFEKMSSRAVVSWNAMISGYVQAEQAEMALQLYARMQKEGFSPNGRTFVCALKACSSLAASEEGIPTDGRFLKQRCLEQVKAIHLHILKSQSGQFRLDLFVGTMLVDVYAKCGSLVDARTIFEEMPRHDVASWNAMILGYAQMEDSEQALQLYRRMQKEGVEPNDRTFVGVFKACGVVAGLEMGKEAYDQMSKLGLGSTGLYVPTTLIDMYGKCGSMVDAQQVFDALPTRDIVTWSALIAGYARQGESDSVFEMFHRMRQEGIEPNGITFLSVLTVCSHAALVVTGQKYFEAMSIDYGITPTMEHYNCMLDLLGRAGYVNEAMEMLKTMPFQPSGDAWRCVLGACRKWGNVEVGKQAFDCAVRLDKNDAAAYVLMSNIYAAAHMWEDAKQTQAMRVRTCAWKKPGQSSWTDIDGIVHTFVVGDREAHPESQQINAKMQHLLLKMKDGGYVPHLDSVLHNISDDEKEDMLCGHSEKLAICYALLKTSPGTTIRVVKNLRVCEDCHRATALIAKIEQRTIICRDAARFHVFKDGKCSCGGYW